MGSFRHGKRNGIRSPPFPILSARLTVQCRPALTLLSTQPHATDNAVNVGRQMVKCGSWHIPSQMSQDRYAFQQVAKHELTFHVTEAVSRRNVMLRAWIVVEVNIDLRPRVRKARVKNSNHAVQSQLRAARPRDSAHTTIRWHGSTSPRDRWAARQRAARLWRGRGTRALALHCGPQAISFRRLALILSQQCHVQVLFQVGLLCVVAIST